MDDTKTWRVIDAALAILTAAILAYGVLVLRWSVFVVVALFWLENVVIGALNVIKMLISGARIGGVAVIGALALAAFFTLHYGMFTVGHGVFVVGLFGESELGRSSNGLFEPLSRMIDYLLSDRDGWLAVIGIVLLQLSMFVRWLSTTQTNLASLPNLMFAPYGRIVILHVTIIASGLLVLALKLPVAGALLLIALKLAFDLKMAASGQTMMMPGWRFKRFNPTAAAEDDAARP
jgi:Family of unknown function (DUF6498)